MGWCQNDLSVWMNIKILLIIIQASVYDNESNSTATVISELLSGWFYVNWFEFTLVIQNILYI